MITTLDSLFDDKKPETVTPSSPAETQRTEPEPEARQEAPAPVEVRGHEGKGEDQDAPPASTEQEPSDVAGLKNALQAERRKRQESQKQLTEREQKLKDYEALIAGTVSRINPQSQQETKPQDKAAPQIPDPWTDPEGAFRYQQEQVQKALFKDRTEISQELMRTKHSDYDDVEKVFIEECKADPQLAQKLRTSSFPARFAYEQGKRIMALREIGPDPTAYKAKLEAEFRAKLAEEAAKTEPAPVASPAPAKQPASVAQPPAPPPSLAGVTSAGPRKVTQKFEGPTPLDRILS